MRKILLFAYIIFVVFLIIAVVFVIRNITRGDSGSNAISNNNSSSSQKNLTSSKNVSGVSSKVKISDRKPAGIENFTLNCFLSTALQALNIDDLYSYLNSESFNEKSLSKILYNLLTKMRRHKGVVSIEDEYKSYIKKLRSKEIKLHGQNSASEVIRKTINVLFQEEVTSKFKHKFKNVDLNNLNYKTHTFLYENSKIYQLFALVGYLESEDKVVADLVSYISPLPSLQKSIDKFCYGEREDFITEIKSNFTIIYIPKILVLDCPEPVSLDRFKLKKHLKISFMKTQYELQSVGLYIPGEHQNIIPHYIAIVRKGNNLYKANDSIVTKFNLVDAKNTTDEHPRCLIYVRRE